MNRFPDRPAVFTLIDFCLFDFYSAFVTPAYTTNHVASDRQERYKKEGKTYIQQKKEKSNRVKKKVIKEGKRDFKGATGFFFFFSFLACTNSS